MGKSPKTDLNRTSTGIYFHYQQGERLRDFPEALEGVLEKANVFFYDAFYPLKPESSFDLKPIPVECLSKVHSPAMVESIRRTAAFEGALFSLAGTVSAAADIWSGRLTNAFVFTGYGDHHAGSDFYGGGCYFNGAAIAIQELREKFGVRRFSIIDTDAHHGNGTWEIFEHDPEVLFLCFCPGASEKINNNFNVHIPYRVTDEIYLNLASEAFEKEVAAFAPQILFWNWGYDGTSGDYGDMGLTPEFHLRLATEIKRLADKVCGGRLVVVLCGGSRRDLATYLIPRIIRILADRTE